MRSLVVWLAACALLSGQQAANAATVTMRNGVFVVKGWTPPEKPPAEGWSALFMVFAGTAADLPALLGDYTVANGALTFRPRYQLSPGLRVRVVFRATESFFQIPAVHAVPSTHVKQVYPSAAAIPENQLKFYIEFSGPMSQGRAWPHIRLLKSDGQPVELPFLEIDQEMWDVEARRLTILFDPGRIKRGVKPLEDTGPAIEAGHSYTLVIDRAWPDAKGASLIDSHRKEFRVVEADRAPIDIADWRLGAVRVQTRDPLTIQFPEPLDAALALRMIWVDGMRGVATLGQEERTWQFVPEQPWTSVAVLKVDSSIEDLAGNRIGRAFDVDLQEGGSRRAEREIVSIPLRVIR